MPRNKTTSKQPVQKPLTRKRKAESVGASSADEVGTTMRLEEKKVEEKPKVEEKKIEYVQYVVKETNDITAFSFVTAKDGAMEGIGKFEVMVMDDMRMSSERENYVENLILSIPPTPAEDVAMFRSMTDEEGNAVKYPRYCVPRRREYEVPATVEGRCMESNPGEWGATFSIYLGCGDEMVMCWDANADECPVATHVVVVLHAMRGYWTQVVIQNLEAEPHSVVLPTPMCLYDKGKYVGYCSDRPGLVDEEVVTFIQALQVGMPLYENKDLSDEERGNSAYYNTKQYKDKMIFRVGGHNQLVYDIQAKECPRAWQVVTVVDKEPQERIQGYGLWRKS